MHGVTPSYTSSRKGGSPTKYFSFLHFYFFFVFTRFILLGLCNIIVVYS